MICPKGCNEDLEESEFDKRIGQCPKCYGQWTDKEYHLILQSINEVIKITKYIIKNE